MVEVRSPFPAEALPRVWAWVQTFRDRVADDFGPTTADQAVRHMLQVVAQDRTWGVYRDGELGGIVVLTADSPYRATGHCIFSRAFWGRQTTLVALRQVCEQVFAGSSTGKIMLFPFADNHQVRALNRELGAVEEGLLRAHTLRGGKPADVIAMALFKEAFYVSSNVKNNVHQHHDEESPARAPGPQ